MQYNKQLRKAVTDLCTITGKPILKLTHADYVNNGLSDRKRSLRTVIR